MRKKNESTGWIGAAITFSVIMLCVYAFVKTNSEFQVKYEQGHQTPGYEEIPAWVTIYASAALKWGAVAAGLKIAGWISFILIPIGSFLAWKWDYKLGTTGTPWMRIALTMGPVLLCAVLWLSSYSSRLDLGAYNQSFDKFRKDMQVSDQLAEKIIKEGGTGNLLIKDENGLLTEWFKANK